MTCEQAPHLARLRAGALQTALDALESQTEATMQRVRASVAEAGLTEIIHALETARNVAETFHELVSALHERATRFRDRELTVRHGEATLNVMDAGLANLNHGMAAAQLVRHLLEAGCLDLRRVADGEA